jgi:hypothetical protein
LEKFLNRTFGCRGPELRPLWDVHHAALCRPSGKKAALIQEGGWWDERD